MNLSLSLEMVFPHEPYTRRVARAASLGVGGVEFWVPLALLLLLLLSAAGCAGRAAPRFTIAVNAGVEGDGLKAAARDYEKLRPDANLEIVELPYANLFEKELLDTTFATGAYDVVMLDDPWFPRLAENEKLAPLEPLYAARGLPGPDEDFIPACLAVCREPYRTGRLYALPFVGNAQLFFYRADLFAQRGLPPPRTWDDVLAAARAFSGAGIYGYVMRASQGNAVVADFLPLFWAFGAEMFGADGRPALESREAVAALKFMLELGRYSPPGYASFNADEVAAHLLQGTAAMSINWPAWILAMDDPRKSRVAGKIAFAPMPAAGRPGRAEIGNWLLAIPRGARHRDRAFEFILWVTAPEQMRRAALRGNPPTRFSIFRDLELVNRFRSYPVQLESLSTSRPRPRTPYWNEIENAFGIYLSQANSGRLTPEEALARAARDIAAIQERTGWRRSE